jgi:hypothetical protein
MLSKVVVSALRSLGATLVTTEASDGVVVTLPKRTGSVLGGGGDAGGVGGRWPGWLTLPTGFAPAVDEPALREEAVGERDGPVPEPRRWVDPTDESAGVVADGSPTALGVLVDHPT